MGLIFRIECSKAPRCWILAQELSFGQFALILLQIVSAPQNIYKPDLSLPQGLWCWVEADS